MLADQFIVQPVEQPLPLEPLLHDEEVRLFLREAPKRHGGARNLMKGAVAVSVLSVIAYAVLFGDALWYSLSPSSSQAVTAVSQPTPPPALAIAGTTTPTPKPTPTIPENTLYYPDAQISIPITWDVSLDPQASQEGLHHGGIHLAGTAKPGQVGMSSISCHSSGYIWDNNPYKNACATLNRAKAGQLITINYKNTGYTYKVQKVYEVNPDDVKILSDNSSTGVRMITCTPIGTDWRRLVVEAAQVDPDPQTNEAFTPSQFAGQLPKDR